jgi:hypothetical protein
MTNLRFTSAAIALLALAACGDHDAVDDSAAAPAPDMAGHDMADMPAGADMGGGMMMTPADPGGFTADGFTFHTRPGTKHLVRLEAPGGDTWRPTSGGEPFVKALETRTETTPEGKAALILEYEMLQSGNAAIVFERLEDGEVEATRTVNFMVH